MSDGDLLLVEGLRVDYPLASGTVHAVSDVAFSVRSGARLGLVGESGSGKTTVALALMGMLRSPGRVVAGRVQLAGQDVLALSSQQHARLRLSQIAYVPQGAMNSLNPVQTVQRSMADGFAEHAPTLGAVEVGKRIDALLDQVGLDRSVAALYPHQLSGGMKQRVCIAIAISLGPKLIVADEPTSALDVVTQRQVMETFTRIQQHLGSALILIGHDLGLMAQTVDELIVMKNGEVVERGAIREIIRSPRHAYTRDLLASVPRFGESRASTKARGAATRGQPPIIELRDVSKAYGAKAGAEPVLHPITMALGGASAEIVAVVGESGSGKTTLGNLVLGFVKPTTGTVRYLDADLGTLPRQSERSFRRDVQAIFQDPYSSFNPFFRVDRALSRPLKRLGVVRDTDEIRVRMERACRAVGLDPGQVLGRYAHQLSGGQRQRLMVARALMLDPKLLVADEPVSMVDASLRHSILDAIRALRDEHGISVLYITHDLATAYRVSDRVIVLEKGRIVESGDPDSVLRAPSHPYTRTLIDSIPWPDPDRQWGNASTHSAASVMANA